MSNESWLSAVSLAGDGDDRVIGARSITATWHLSVSDQVAPRKRLSRRALMETQLPSSFGQLPKGHAKRVTLERPAGGANYSRL